MNWEAATFALSVIVVVLQFTNIYISTRIKLWTVQNFVSKTDFLETLHMWGVGQTPHESQRRHQ